ncbi:MAG: HdeD family acid-resistance protein [Yoonia sp.]|nr:HdeD family acid-resistance protein [Yoonia sp.]
MSDPTPNTDIMNAVREHRGKFRNLGYVLIALGVLAILFPLVFSIAAKALLGWVFLLTGAALLYHAFQAKGWQSGIWSGLIAILHIALGVYLGFFALTGLVGLTALMGVIFLIQGGFEAVMAAQHRPRKGWGWLAFNGAATLVLGVLLIAGLPGTALWAVGLFLGLNFLTSGIAFVALSRVA